MDQETDAITEKKLIHRRTWKCRTALLLALLLVGIVIAPAQKTSRLGRYDPQIEQKLRNYLKNEEFNKVTVSVEDGVVSLGGTVELLSEREALETRASHIEHVSGVLNHSVLDPPAESDETLYGKVKEQLSQPHFAQLKLLVHQGRVIVSGQVHTDGDYTRVLSLLYNTPGVKEVQADLHVMETAGGRH